MSRNNDLHERIARLFAEGLNVEIPSAESNLFDNGVLDSLGFVELLVLLEREFGIATSVDDMEVENFKSIARIAEFVASRVAVDRQSTIANPTA
ncbi:MAG TPA: acyl carrier protein [Vicinamibacterales bacterium]|jgi:acyl carrier protein